MAVKKRIIPALLEYHLDNTINTLEGPSKEQIIVFNQWAAVGLDKYHNGSNVKMNLSLDGVNYAIILNWKSDFSKDAMVEARKIAEEGGVSIAMFIMSVLLDFHYLQQTEIGEGVDYRFQTKKPSSDNFLNDSHYVEISGLLEETPSNTLKNRVRVKHRQIERGTHQKDLSSVIITLFEKPISIKEIHQ